MRNLKRALSLALASVMVLGLMIVGTSAAGSDFADADEIVNKEAVDVMSAIGVIEGDGTGNFNPNGTFNREQAAKIISVMLLGEENADKLGNNTQIFSDVAAGRWSAGYIAYCASMGIISGDGAGKFLPEGELTAVAFGKMLLVALGYDADVENYVNNPNWATNVANDMMDAGIAVNTVFTDTLTREQATEMAFKTLTADMVRYASKGTLVETSEGVTIRVNATPADKVGNNVSDDYRTTDKDDVQQFCEKYFPKLTAQNSTTDDMGHPANEWKYENGSVGTYAEEPDYAGFITSKNNTFDKLVDTFSKRFKTTSATETYLNGKLGAPWTAAIGDYVELYMDEDDAEIIDTVAVTHWTVAELTGDPIVKAVSDDDDQVRVPGVIDTYSKKATVETVHGYADLAEDDVVLYYVDNDDNYWFELADNFAGIMTAAAENGKLTIGGTKYDRSGATDTMALSDMRGYNKEEATWYTDKGGNVIYVKGVESTEIAYVVSLKTDTTGWDDHYASTGENTALLLFPDNTVETVTYKNGNGFTAEANSFVKYSVKDDVYTLSDAGDYSANKAGEAPASTPAEVIVTKGNPTVKFAKSGNDIKTNSETLFFVREYDDAKVKNSYTMYTGYAAAPSIAEKDVTGGSAVAYLGANGYAKYIVIDAHKSIADSTTSDDMFYVVSNKVTTLYEDGKAMGYTVRAVKYGGDEIVDLEFASSPTVKAYTGYVAKTYNSDGQIVTFDAITNDSPKEYIVGEKTGKGVSGSFTLGGEAYGYTDDTVVYYIDSDDELSVLGVSNLGNDENDTFVAVRVSGEADNRDYNTIDALFVHEVADPGEGGGEDDTPVNPAYKGTIDEALNTISVVISNLGPEADPTAATYQTDVQRAAAAALEAAGYTVSKWNNATEVEAIKNGVPKTFTITATSDCTELDLEFVTYSSGSNDSTQNLTSEKTEWTVDKDKGILTVLIGKTTTKYTDGDHVYLKKADGAKNTLDKDNVTITRAEGAYPDETIKVTASSGKTQTWTIKVVEKDQNVELTVTVKGNLPEGVRKSGDKVEATITEAGVITLTGTTGNAADQSTITFTLTAKSDKTKLSKDSGPDASSVDVTLTGKSQAWEDDVTSSIVVKTESGYNLTINSITLPGITVDAG